MGKLVEFNFVTLDGYYATTDGGIDWHVYDNEMADRSRQEMTTYDALIFGRTTYDLMAGYWPTPQGMESEPNVAEIMNSIPKYVYSKSMTDVADGPVWKNTTVLHDIDPKEIEKLKADTVKDIAIFGSGTIVQQFIKLGLLDEHRLIVNPVILGKGKQLFQGVEPHNLKLVRSKSYESGNVYLNYTPA